MSIKDTKIRFDHDVKIGANKSNDAFLDVFDPSISLEQSFCRGEWDFSYHIGNNSHRKWIN